MKHDPTSDFRRNDLERMKLAADVIIGEAGQYGEIIPDSLESELVIFRGRVETALLLPEAAGQSALA